MKRTFALSVLMVALAVRSAQADTFVIEPPIAKYIGSLDERELREQVRDWAVFGTLARLGATPEEAAAATYELPPARMPELQELYTFEHGRGRRAYFRNRVLLFRDADDPAPTVTIARLADRARMENGSLPTSLEVYLIHDEHVKAAIQVERAADIPTTQLFSAAYGYVDGEATGPEQLRSWLDRADDLTYARLAKDGRLYLGGRRFGAGRPGIVTVDDVAAMYQAHAQLAAPVDRARQRLRAALPGSRAIIDAGKERGMELLGSVFERDDLDLVADALKSIDGIPTPGFSLDPEWLPDPAAPNHPLLLARLRAFAANPCADLRAIYSKADALMAAEPDPTRRNERTYAAAYVHRLLEAPKLHDAMDDICAEIKQYVSPAVEEAANAMAAARPESWGEAMVQYEILAEKLAAIEETAAVFAHAALRFHDADSQVQCARYIGLAGTQAGMTLFYTDLLAKLWVGIDRGMSAPLVEVPGFLTTPQMDLPATYGSEELANPAARIWFGPNSDAVSRKESTDGSALFFAPRFNRIYSAGSNPAKPGEETKATEIFARTLGWWERHFDDVADYEPQFHRQNQLIKWSLLTARLGQSARTSWLGGVHVNRSATFVGWYRANGSRLRFSEALPAPVVSPAKKECLPLFASYTFTSSGAPRHIAGGVSTAGRETLALVPSVRPNNPLGARKAIGKGLAGESVQRTNPALAGREVHFDNAAPTAPIKQVVYDVSPGTALDITADGTSSNFELIARQEGQRTVLATREGVEQKPSLAAADKLAREGETVAAARMYEVLPPQPTAKSALDLAREVVVAAARRRADLIEDKLRQIVQMRAHVTPEVRTILRAGVNEGSTKAAAQYIEHALDGGPAPMGFTMGVRGDRVVIVRDVDGLPMSVFKQQPPTDIDANMYVARDVNVAREGLLGDTGGSAARWSRVKGTRMSEVDPNTFAAAESLLPDVIHDRSTDRVFDLKHEGKTKMGPAIFVYTCDDSHRTATTDDDC